MPDYVVKQGDCISSIAFEQGFFPETIWDHPKNAFLKQQREDPNVLFENDVVFIPDKEQKREMVACDKRSSFKIKGVPARLRLTILDTEYKPRSGEVYTLDLDGVKISGNLDADGNLDVSISPAARTASLLIGDKVNPVRFELSLGNLDPLNTISGVQDRLNNLGFNCGIERGIVDDQTHMAIRLFQKKYELPEDGEIGDQLKQKLKEMSGR
jgi:hypothetical protein